MRKFSFLVFLFFISIVSVAQKKPLDHSVYDAWQSIGERMISNNGKYVVYTINPQEGDATLVIQTSDGKYKKEIARGYNAMITEDNLFVVFKIKPLFKDTRDAKIKKKKPDEMPKDSLAIVELGKDSITKIAGVKSYKMPEKSAGWLAYLSEKGFPEIKKIKSEPDSLTRLNNISRMADSLVRVVDSLRNKAEEARTKGMSVLQPAKKETKKSAEETIEEGTELVLRNLQTGEEKRYKLVSDYLFSKNGKKFLIETTKKNSDSLSKDFVLLMSIPEMKIDTVMKNFNDAKNYAFDEDGNQLAFVAERDSVSKSLHKFYKLWYYKNGLDSAQLRGDINTSGVSKGLTISENYNLNFSKDGNRLFVGLATIKQAKDTTVPDFEKAGVDVWNYNDDNLQPVQLKNLERDLKKSYLAVWDVNKNSILQLGDEKFPDIQITKEGNGDVFYAASDFGKRIARQWQGFALSDVYAVNANSGEKKLIIKDFKGNIYPSYTGKYLLLYNDKQKGYSVYNSETNQLYKVAADIKVPLYDEENDVPDDPQPYGIAGWEKDDKHIYIYDRYDIWKVDADGKGNSERANLSMRFGKISIRYVNANKDEKYINPNDNSYFKLYSEISKKTLYSKSKLSMPADMKVLISENELSCNGFLKADSVDMYLYVAENYTSSPNIFAYSYTLDSLKESTIANKSGFHVIIGSNGIQLSHINPQQSQYLCGSAELFKWKAYTGKETEGILYKPENFDAKKKYPMIVYFYERNNNTLYNYLTPSPTPSRLNIPFFVSRGYVVFVPDIWYTTGHPGKNAYDYIVSGTRALIKQGFIDSTKIGLQGQSWGGYQTAILITQTNLFAAAWAGAPVVNMFSAYGGIRWESGLNRQFQYEHSQSRIGATIWERPDLYIENSPLFHLQKVKTPLVIMSNDADGAVPWYQGIEFFTAMRRLNKPVWLLQYNGEAHNLVERRNRKDIQIREQQFFDWLLKGEKPPVWITEGVPATLKGIDYGLEIK
ncbi:MAG TPA: prolyl oligopeptidase family serine peptidase [Puia sp.]|nr:prolyl oligopeptidase family serine peptidase [Puia sp.]